MPALRFLALVSLALWVGALAALGVVVAPVLFAVLPLADPQGQTLAGAAFGAVLESAERVALFLGAIVALTFAWRSTRRPRPRGLWWRSAALALMLGATAVTGLVLGPRIDAIRTQTRGPITDLAETDPARIAFGRLHGLSGALMVGTVALGLVLMWKEMRDA